MKKLGVIKAYGHRFNFIQHTKKENENWGETLFTKQKITIARWLKGRKREETILHEILHIVNEFSALRLSESKIKRLSYGLFGLLKDNFSVNLNSLKKENKES